MKTLMFSVVVAVFCLCPSAAKEAAPKVQVYSRAPGMLGVENTFICHVSGFHPPEITIQLLRNRKEITGATQTDLAFEENWHYHLTKHVRFTPQKGEEFACNVTHMGKAKIHTWEPDM